MQLVILAYHIPERYLPTRTQPFPCSLTHTARCVLSKLLGIHFRHCLQHRFENDRFISVTDSLRNRKHAHTILFELGFINRRIVAVPRKSIQFPNDYSFELPLGAVCNHPLEVGTLIAYTADGSVDICTDNRHTRPLCISVSLSKLPFDRLLRLLVGGISCIDDCVH